MMKKPIPLLQRCQDKSVKLHRGKLQLRLKEVACMGHVLSADDYNLTLKRSRQPERSQHRLRNRASNAS